MLRGKVVELMLLSGLGAALFTLPAAAKTHEFEPATLRWRRAEDATACPDEWEVASAVEARLGAGALVPPAKATLLVDASIRAGNEGGFEVDIALVRGDVVVGRRELSSPEPNCSAAAEQAALVIALAIDPEASLADPAPPSPPSPPPASSPPVASAGRAPEPVRVPVAAPAAARPELTKAPPWGADLELATGGATGSVPELAPGLFLRGRGRPPGIALSFELEAAYVPQEDLQLEPGRGAHFTWWYVGAALCNRTRRPDRLRFSVCGGPELGAVTGQGYGFQRTPRVSSYALAVAARVRLGFRVTRGLSIVLGPDLVVPFRRERFIAITSAGSEELFRTKPAGFGFELGGVWELGS